MIRFHDKNWRMYASSLVVMSQVRQFHFENDLEGLWFHPKTIKNFPELRLMYNKR